MSTDVSKQLRGSALLSAGFRLFFLMGALVAVLWVGAWIGSLAGWWSLHGRIGGLHWHRHEMLFGFATAVFAGFFLTAVSQWTKRPTVGPFGLGVLGLLWFLGRCVVWWSAHLPMALVGVIDASFLFVLACVIARPLWESRSWRNLGFVPLLCAMAFANALVYLQSLGLVGHWAGRSTMLMFHLSLLLVALIGGRIIPLFTQNKLRSLGRDVDVQQRVFLGRFAATSLGVAAIGHFVGLSAVWWSGVMALAGVLLGIRLFGWCTRHILDVPMMWILHLGYGCLAFGLVWYGIEGLYAMGHTTAAMHLLALGCIGVMCLGMMSRVALGHTGRAIKATPLTVLAFSLLFCAVLSRVIPAVWYPQWYLQSLLVSGLLWCMAFLLYLVVFWRILWHPRADGRPG